MTQDTNLQENHSDGTRKLPRILAYLQDCPWVDQFAESDAIARQAVFEPRRNINILESGQPLYMLPARKPYTSVMTPGHTSPGGYLPSGKYRPTKYIPGKMDKRSGK